MDNSKDNIYFFLSGKLLRNPDSSFPKRNEIDISDEELMNLFKPSPFEFRKKIRDFIICDKMDDTLPMLLVESNISKEDALFLAIYSHIFGELPIGFMFTSKNKNSWLIDYGLTEESSSSEEVVPWKTFLNLKKKFGDSAECFIIDFTPYLVLKDGVLFSLKFSYSSKSGYSLHCYFPQKINRDFLKEVLNCIVFVKEKKDSTIQYLIRDKNGYNLQQLPIKTKDISIDENYNSDIPDKQIVDFINSDESGIAILHGNPGTGKSTYIRNLIYRTSKEFIFLDKNVLSNITDSSLINLFLKHENAVIVLEDCEDLIAKGRTSNPFISTILNLSDGIVGDSMRFKFICTFNIDIGEIDDAILRKGRMKIKYEFTSLSEDKTLKLLKKLYPEIEIPKNVGPMPLSDIYNYKDSNGNKKKETMGFH